MNTSKLSFPRAILMLPKKHRSFIVVAKAVRDALKGNPSFPALGPSVAVLDADIAEYEDAETKAASKTKGTAALRDAKKKKVMDDLRYLREDVQRVVDLLPTPVDAAAAIESAFMSVKKPPSRSKQALSVKNNGTSGTVILRAKAEARATAYYWQYSLDQETWTNASETTKASTVIKGLSPATTYAFRFRALTPDGAPDYSQVVTLVVH